LEVRVWGREGGGGGKGGVMTQSLYALKNKGNKKILNKKKKSIMLRKKPDTQVSYDMTACVWNIRER
jgi:hypothetical protein